MHLLWNENRNLHPFFITALWETDSPEKQNPRLLIFILWTWVASAQPHPNPKGVCVHARWAEPIGSLRAQARQICSSSGPLSCGRVSSRSRILSGNGVLSCCGIISCSRIHLCTSIISCSRILSGSRVISCSWVLSCSRSRSGIMPCSRIPSCGGIMSCSGQAGRQRAGRASETKSMSLQH